MGILQRIYILTHKKSIAAGGDIPYYWKYSLGTVLAKPVRKFFSAAVIPFVPFNGLRVWLYRLCGYRIGRNVFIGMRCYLDDMCYDKIYIGNNVTISYGVFFACHGRGQGHNRLLIKENAYIGMRASIVARENLVIGRNAVVGACSLVNKSIPENCTSVGVPNRIIKRT